MEKFAFIIHPLETKDVARKFPFISRWPEALVEKALQFVPPLTASHITGVKSATGTEAEGWFIGVPLTPKMMMNGMPEKQVLAKIIAAGRKAEEHGAQIVGLGAFTSIVGDAGVTIANNLNIAVTTGNTYTVATALQGVQYAAGLMEVDLSRTRVAILGATGSIGKACARIMAGFGYPITLVARDKRRLEDTQAIIYAESGNQAKIETDLPQAVREAGVVIAVTSALEAVVDAADLQPGAIVCDVSRPRNVSKLVAESRKDVLVFEGGVVAVPGDVDFHFNFGFPPRTSYACMAETMILALEQRYENYSLGRDIELDKVREISLLAEKHGFKLAGLRSFERALTEADIMAVKQQVKVGK
ncbi:MAG TPA: shikimate dehydrogenase [Firmicutes bacterium]|nr:shikimate dehydrogenase [Bacillota bacterium]